MLHFVLLLSNWSLLFSSSNVILSIRQYLIVDEGHRIKNHRCTLLSSLKKLKAANRLLLTGYVMCFVLFCSWFVSVEFCHA